MKNKVKNFFLTSHYVICLMALLLVVIFASLVSSSFLKIDNLVTIIRQASILLILCSGLTAVIITGGIDLSVGSVAGFVGCLVARLMVNGVSPIVAAVVGILCGALVGAFNGFLIGVLKLPPFISTYGTDLVISGIAVIVMKGSVIYGLPENFKQLGVGYVGNVPIPIIIAAVITFVMYIILQKTTFGRNIYMYGSNPYAAKYSAMKDLAVLISAYMICGVTAAIGGLIMTARLNAADASMGTTYGLQIVAAVVMGGTSLLGGEGSIIGTVIGALVLTIITNVMNLLGITSFLQPLTAGVVIITMVWIDIFMNKQRAKIRR